MKTITIHKSDVNINNQDSIVEFNKKLRKISEPFKVKFGFPIKRIPVRLFNMINLAKIDIPNSVTSIHYNAFYGCESLTKIILPNSITEIAAFAFNCCTYLEEITIPSSIKVLGTNIFIDCDSLRQITIQQSKDLFLKNVEGAQRFFNTYKDLIIFEDLKSIDMLLSETNSIEQMMTSLDER